MRSLRKLKNSKELITIKPADKNLGVVILDTTDYINQCIAHLATPSYNLVAEFPIALKKELENIIISFKDDLTYNIIKSKSLYHHLLPNTKHRIPKFYGLPKVHKQFDKIPPLRPVVSHSNSLLSTTAKFLDFILQPIAKSYPDYLNNSTELINILSNLSITTDVVLVTMDIVNLYPSIPQQGCLEVINEELQTHHSLLMFNPNLITNLLSLHMNNNFFEFSNFVFHQIKGIAMGAAFSPTVANIYMSAFFRKFLATQQNKPLLLCRYIDDIFILWPKSENLSTFTMALNKFHSSIKFTITTSQSTVNYLDLTISKNNTPNNSLVLTIQTYEKPNNLFQYLHYTSNHPKSTFKGIIIGECIRHARNNSSESLYQIQIEKFRTRLQRKSYPIGLINNCFKKVHYHNRNQYIQEQIKPSNPIKCRPILKCPLPPQYSLLQKVILTNHKLIQDLVQKPIFIYTSHKTIKKSLVNAKHNPNEQDLIDIYASCQFNYLQEISPPTVTTTTTSSIIQHTPKPCRSKKCSICQYYNPAQYFISTSTKQKFRIKHSFTCNSTNIIYLITCKKCRKQYVGKTTKTLRERINRHKATIRSKQKIYISVHFNFPDHKLSDLSVQIIDTSTPEKLRNLEIFWIHKLQTYLPKGLNFDI